MLRLLPLIAFVALLLIPGVAAAHDAENTHVLITFSSDDRYRIDILNDADWMWLHLVGADATLPVSTERDRQLDELTEHFRQSVTILFGGKPAAIDSVEYVPPAGSTPTSVIRLPEPGLMRLSGPVPADASTLQFAYDLIEDP